MKRLTVFILGILLITLSACTPMIYGVPQETWDGMSEEQRTVTIELYQEQRLSGQRAAEERARQHAMYLEEQRQLELAEAEAMRYQVDAIYRGKGNYGDLLRVRIENGMANFRGQVREFDTVAFQIAKGEDKEITFSTTKNRTVLLSAFYDGTILYLDGNKNTRSSHVSRLIYDQRWSGGLTYTDVYTNNKTKLQRAEVTVEIIGGQRNGGRYPTSGPTTIIIKEQPQTIIIKKSPSKSVIYDTSREASHQQRNRQEQLRKERYALEKERKSLERDQAEFDVKQLTLEKEEAELEKKRERIRQMKKEADLDKRQPVRENPQTFQERERAVKELKKAVEDNEKSIADNEQVVAQKEKKIKESRQKVNKQEKPFDKKEKEFEKEKKVRERKEQKQSQDNKDHQAQ